MNKVIFNPHIMLNTYTKTLLLSLFLSCSSLQAQLDIYVFGDRISTLINTTLTASFTTHNFTFGNTTAPNRNDLTVPDLGAFDMVVFLAQDEDGGDLTPDATMTALLAYVNAGGYLYANLEYPRFNSDGSTFPRGINYVWNAKLQGQLQDPVFDLRGSTDSNLFGPFTSVDRITFIAPPLPEKNYLRHGKYTYDAAQLAARTFVLEPNDLTTTGAQGGFASEIIDPPAGSLVGVNSEPEMYPLAILLYGPKHFLSPTAGALYMNTDLDFYGGAAPRSSDGFLIIENFINLVQANISTDALRPMEFGRN